MKNNKFDKNNRYKSEKPQKSFSHSNFQENEDESGVVIGRNAVRELLKSERSIEKILTKEIGFTILGLTFSPVKGPEGNIEFLAHLTLADQPGIEPDTDLVVQQAHSTLKG